LDGPTKRVLQGYLIIESLCSFIYLVVVVGVDSVNRRITGSTEVFLSVSLLKACEKRLTNMSSQFAFSCIFEALSTSFFVFLHHYMLIYGL